MPRLGPSVLATLVLALGACFVEPDEGALATIDQEIFSPSVADLNAYVQANACANAADTKCLERLTVNACSSGCPRHGYNWRGEVAGRIDPHMTLTYLRKLRNAAAAAPDEYPLFSVGFGVNMEDMLWHQVQMMLRSQTQFYATNLGTNEDQLPPLSAGAVSTSNIVDPTRFYAVAWVNSGGTAHAMAQADMGLWFQHVALNFTNAGDDASALYYLRLSERAFRTFALRDRDGGVRNNKRSYKCYALRPNLYCYWFHSFAVGEYAYPSSVLNQNLHAIRDAMEAHDQLRAWPGGIPAGIDPDHLSYLQDWARGGLLQLAFGPGNGVDSAAPPNLAEFQVVVSDPETVCASTSASSGYAAYDYALGGTRICIKPDNTCHYHYHSLSVLKRIIELVDLDPAFAGDSAVIDAKYKLLYGRGQSDTRTCTTSGIPASARVMTGVPLARLYNRSATTSFRLHCDGDPDNDSYQPREDCNRPDANDGDCPLRSEYADAADWANTSTPLRAWYDTTYTGCTF